MEAAIPYFVCALGAVVLFVLLRPGKTPVKAAAGIVGICAFAWLLVESVKFICNLSQADDSVPIAQRPEFFFTIFSLIAVACAVRMITHTRPVYCALYFIMVVLSSAALFLLLEAEFMAFALVIVYAGAILITYLFVLMLAQQAPDADNPDAQPEYDVIPREPANGAIVGFILLALFSNMIFSGTGELPPPPTTTEVLTTNWKKLDLMQRDLKAIVDEVYPGSELVQGATVRFDDGSASVEVTHPSLPSPIQVELPPHAMPSNVQYVGLDLVAKFPVSLELAGIILLMAMFGAVVLARKQIELGEEEVREAAGMPRRDARGESLRENDGGGRWS